MICGQENEGTFFKKCTEVRNFLKGKFETLWRKFGNFLKQNF